MGETELNAGWDPPLRKLMKRAGQLSPRTTSQLNVNVVFHVPGRFLQPEFVGARTGTFRKHDRLVMVQVALPESPPTDIDTYLAQRLSEAMDVLAEWVSRRKLGFDLAPLREVFSMVSQTEKDAVGL